MTTLVARAYEPVNNYTSKTHAFSIVADDTGFMYVFGSNAAGIAFDSKTRVADVMAVITTPVNQLKAVDYIGISEIELDAFIFDAPFEAANKAIAIRDEQLDIDKALFIRQSVKASVAGLIQAQRVDQVMQDFPDLYDQLSSGNPKQQVTADGMIELIFSALGSVDPSGPNAWLLNYIDGTAPESEDAGGDIVFNEDSGDSSTTKTGDN